MSKPDHASGSRAEARRGVEAVFERYFKLAPGEDATAKLFDYDCMKTVELVDAGPEGSVVFKFKVTQRYANLNNVLHGGAAAMLFDMFTTTALGPLARPGYWDFLGGVTRSLSITYIKAVPLGTTVWFRSRVVGVSKRLAFIRSEMTSEDPSFVYATAEHHKVYTPMLPAHQAQRVPWDDAIKIYKEVIKSHL